ncbi:MAG: GDSL-type esterase/lipase family protein [Asticcacaulis sp.]
MESQTGGRTVPVSISHHFAEEQATPMLFYPGRTQAPVALTIGEAYQWPGVYFETRFHGSQIELALDDDTNILLVYVDDEPPIKLIKPGKQGYVIRDLAYGPHRLRIEKITESQGNTARFGGFFAKNGYAEDIKPLSRQIEFIGDSFTVGYGNTSTTQTCTEAEVWQTTDTSQAFGPLTAKAFNADYQINAFSGRGIVRNYDSFKGPTLPELYSYALFDGQTVYNNPDWQPQIIVIGLGTNDFSTPVKPDDKWADTEALHADYRRGYVAFVKDLRARNPNAHFILMSSDRFDGSLRDNVRQVADTLRAEGETRLDTLFFDGLDYGGCHYHPSLNDHMKINTLLTDYFSRHPDLWQGR